MSSAPACLAWHVTHELRCSYERSRRPVVRTFPPPRSKRIRREVLGTDVPVAAALLAKGILSEEDVIIDATTQRVRLTPAAAAIAEESLAVYMTVRGRCVCVPGSRLRAWLTTERHCHWRRLGRRPTEMP